MCTAIQYLSFLGILENDLAQLWSIEMAVRQKDFIAKMLSDELICFSSRLNNISGNLVGINDGNVLLF